MTLPAYDGDGVRCSNPGVLRRVSSSTCIRPLTAPLSSSERSNIVATGHIEFQTRRVSLFLLILIHRLASLTHRINDVTNLRLEHISEQ